MHQGEEKAKSVRDFWRVFRHETCKFKHLLLLLETIKNFKAPTVSLPLLSQYDRIKSAVDSCEVGAMAEGEASTLPVISRLRKSMVILFLRECPCPLRISKAPKKRTFKKYSYRGSLRCRRLLEVTLKCFHVFSRRWN